VPDLSLCLGVFKHRAPLARRSPSSYQNKLDEVYMSDLI